MKEVVYVGPTAQVVPEMTAQDDIGGTLVLRPGQSYAFDGVPPGDPSWWAPKLEAKEVAKPSPVVPVTPPVQEG